MNFNISVQTLKSALKKLDKFYKGKTGERFKQIKCSCSEESLCFQSRVSEQTIRIEYKIEDFGIIVHSEGATVLDYVRFKAMVDSLSDKEFAEIDQDNRGNVILTCGRSAFRFATESPETFRDVKPSAGGAKFRFNANELVSALNLCVKVVDEKQKHPFETVHICKSDDEGKIDVVGSDQRSMCRVKIECVEYPDSYEKGILISRTSAIVCAGLYETCYNEDGYVEFTCNDNTCVVNDGQTSYYISLIEGRYPNYKKLYQFDDNWGHLIVNRNEFLAALKQVSTVTTDEYPGAQINFDNDCLDIRSASPEYGEARTMTPCDGAPVGSMKFGAKLLMDCFPFDLEKVEIITPPNLNSRIIINPSGNIAYLVMPISSLEND